MKGMYFFFFFMIFKRQTTRIEIYFRSKMKRYEYTVDQHRIPKKSSVLTMKIKIEPKFINKNNQVTTYN